MANDFYGIEQEEQKEKKEEKNFIEKLFGFLNKKDKNKKSKKNNDDTDNDNPYGVELEETETTGFYGIEEEKKPEKREYKVHFKWYDYIIIIVEILLIFYTILVLLRIVPLF